MRLSTPSPSMVVAICALIVAMSGTGYAAIKLPRNAVGTTQLKANSVTGGKVRNGSLSRADFKRGTLLAGARGAAGPAGAVGAAGSPGTPGATGATGAYGEVTVARVDAPVPDDGIAVGILATCPAGTKIIGGGATLAASAATDVNLTVSRPAKSGNPNNGLPESGESFDGWRVVYVNQAGDTGATTGRAFAICAEAP